MMLIRIWQNDGDTGLAKFSVSGSGKVILVWQNDVFFISGFGKVMLIRIRQNYVDPDPK
jgi:hypothetical protein